MKRLIIALAILLLLPTGIWLTCRYTGGTTENLAGLVERARTQAQDGDREAALQTLQELDKKMKKDTAIFSLYVRHSELDVLMQENARLIPLLTGDDSAGFDAACSVVRMQLHHIDETEQLRWENVF